MKSKHHLLILGALSACLFTLNIWGYDLWPPDEPRFAQVSREMMMSGDYLAPHMNGEPYMEKPPLFFWLIAAVSAPVGDVTEWTARIPSAMAGVVTVLLTYALANRLYGATVAFWSGLILMTFQRFWWQARFGQIDMTLTACLTGALLCLWLWHTERRTRYLVGLYGGMAAGLLAKGPPALVFPLLTAVFFYWGKKNDRRSLHLVIGVIASIAVVLIWFIPARMAVASAGTEATQQIGSDLYRQIIGRLFLGISKDQPFYYYLVNLPADLLPWTVCLPWTVLWVWRHRREDDRVRFLLSWTLPAIAFFSLSSGKRALYLLPLHPAFAILIAWSLLPLVQGDHRRWRTGIAGVWAAILLIIAVAPYAVLFTDYADSWHNSFLAITALAVVFAAQTIADIRREGRQFHRNLFAHFAVLSSLLAIVVFPAINLHKSARDFCEPLRELSRRGVEYELISYGFSREEYVFYAEHFHTFVPHIPVEEDGLTDEERTRVSGASNHMMKHADVRLGTRFDETDVRELQEALAEAYSAAQLSEAAAEAHRAAVSNAVAEFIEAFRAPAPAFIILRERSWRWIVAYYPDANREAVVREEPVGSRHVVLVANEAAREVMAAEGLALPEAE